MDLEALFENTLDESNDCNKPSFYFLATAEEPHLRQCLGLSAFPLYPGA